MFSPSPGQIARLIDLEQLWQHRRNDVVAITMSGFHYQQLAQVAARGASAPLGMATDWR